SSATAIELRSQCAVVLRIRIDMAEQTCRSRECMGSDIDRVESRAEVDTLIAGHCRIRGKIHLVRQVVGNITIGCPHLDHPRNPPTGSSAVALTVWFDTVAAISTVLPIPDAALSMSTSVVPLAFAVVEAFASPPSPMPLAVAFVVCEVLVSPVMRRVRPA